ncbi:MAG: hypothetical protein KatS3mg008_2061 [Acidimicrobiales bacterium]|nr:MAG: hypothetical protein KatS3mg008_2061 [Acidimicrobiales bacterium]
MSTGLADLLGYVVRRPNGFQRFGQRVASSRPGAWLLARTLTPLDRVLQRLTGGRSSLPTLFAGLPVVEVTTRGRRSGQLRTNPLVAVPFGGNLALIGTNFGQAATPGWVYNIEADPHVVIGYRGRRVEAVARHADEEEAASIWQRAAEMYPGYELYKRRIRGRRIRVFVLEAARPSES